MAYNREWDRGKDQWAGDESWNEAGGGGWKGRPREEDYYGEGKRRKFNNGGHDPQAYEGGGAWDGASAHVPQESAGDWQQEAYDDRPYRGTKKRLVPSEPSPHVIFLGLDPDFTEADLQAYLASNGCSIETVTIIRDRSTGLSKGFGFAQFTSAEHAKAYVEPSFPFVQIPPPASHGASATAAFHKALETGGPHNGRRVKIDFSQSANPADKARRTQNTNDATRDIGNTQSPVLLLRGLDLLSGTQAIAQALMASSGPGKEGARGMRRIILIKDKVTMASWGFAFVEFVDVQSASAVLGATMSPQIHPEGFRISDRPVAVSFAHPYSFQPVDPMHRDEAALASSMSMGGMEGGWVRYWDEASTVVVAEFQVEAPTQSSAATKEKEKKRKTKVAGDAAALRPIPLEASTLPVSDKPVTLSFNKGGLALNKTGNAPGAAGKGAPPVSFAFSAFEDSGDAGDEADEQVDAANAKVAAARKVAPMIASKKIANNINKWNQVQEVLSQPGQAPGPAAAATAATAAATAVPVAGPSSTVAVASQEPAMPLGAEAEFADPSGKLCLLCARQFKSPEVLKRHSKESDLHKKNYQDVNLREIARGKVLAAKQAAEGKSADAPKYRDRASERRVMHNQPEAPLPAELNKVAKKKFAEGPPPPPSPPPPPVHPGKDENNVGNKLLKMMGWKEGMGLGASADGIVDPIQTAIYAQGVGLGASKGREVGKYADGYAGYVQQAQDAARERYGP